MAMLEKVFPDVVNNDYEGSQWVFWMLCLFTGFSIFRSFVHIFKFDGGAQSIATIPLDKWPSEAADV